MLPMTWRKASWCVATAALIAAGQAAGEERDSAALAPADALVCLGWSHVSDGSDLFKLVHAVLASPVVQKELDAEGRALAVLVPLAELLGRHTGAIALLSVGPEPQLGVVVDAGADAERAAAQFRTFVEGMSPAQSIEPATVAGAALSRRTDEPPLLWGVHQGRFVVGIGEDAAEKLISLIDGRGKSLATAAELVRAREKIRPGEAGWHLSLFGDVRTLLSLVERMDEGAVDAEFEKNLQTIGLDRWRSFYLHCDRAEYGTRVRAFARVEGGEGGVAKLWQQKPLTDADIALLPKDAIWGSVSNLDLHELWQEFTRVVGRSDPDAEAQLEGVLAAATQFLGFSITDDLLPALGDTWAIYDAQSHGGLLITGAVLVADVKDAQKLSGMLERIVELTTPLAQQQKLHLQLKEMKHGQHTIKYLLLGGMPIPIAPAWGFVDNRWVFGLFPQTVAVAMQQADPRTRKESLLDHPDFKAARPGLPRELTGLSFSDTRQGYRVLYPLMHLAATAVAALSAGSAEPYDLAGWPTFPAELAQVRSSISGTSWEADGALYTGLGSSPAAYFSSGNPSVATVALLTSILLPSLTRARELAKRAVCAANLRGIGQACHIYANDHGENFPPDLEDLITAKIIVPKMLICPDSPLDEAQVTAILAGESNQKLPYRYIDKQTTAGDVRNVLIYEDLDVHNGEGGNVLFVDAHVEFLKPPAYQRAIRETYKRLKREAEIPAELQSEDE